MGISEADRSGRIVFETTGLTAGHGAKAVVKGLDLGVMRGDRLGLVGPNGTGKTTLLRTLLGELPPLAGTVRRGANLQVVWYDPLNASLDPDRSVRDSVADGADQLDIDGRRRHVVSYLADFLFASDRSNQPVRLLSGGERARLLLARLFAKPSNVLVLDEPTNDLDAETMDVLEDVLLAYQGTVLVVSHDRDFLDQAVTGLLVFEGNGRVREVVGGWSEWLRIQKKERAAARTSTSGPPAKPTGKTAPAPAAEGDAARSQGARPRREEDRDARGRTTSAARGHGGPGLLVGAGGPDRHDEGAPCRPHARARDRLRAVDRTRRLTLPPAQGSGRRPSVFLRGSEPRLRGRGLASATVGPRVAALPVSIVPALSGATPTRSIPRHVQRPPADPPRPRGGRQLRQLARPRDPRLSDARPGRGRGAHASRDRAVSRHRRRGRRGVRRGRAEGREGPARRGVRAAEQHDGARARPAGDGRDRAPRTGARRRRAPHGRPPARADVRRGVGAGADGRRRHGDAARVRRADPRDLSTRGQRARGAVVRAVCARRGPRARQRDPGLPRERPRARVRVRGQGPADHRRRREVAARRDGDPSRPRRPVPTKGHHRSTAPIS